MDKRIPYVLGASAALFLALYLIKREEGEDLLDSVVDWLTILTTSEQSRLAALQPEVADKVRELISRAHDEGVEVYVGQTLRTPAQEKAVIDAGKSAVKTHSWHELGRGVDVYPQLPNGKPDYNATDLDAFRTMHRIAVDIGFRSLAFEDDGSKHLITNSKGKKIWDGGHIEWRSPHGSIAEAVRVEGSSYGIA